MGLLGRAVLPILTALTIAWSNANSVPGAPYSLPRPGVQDPVHSETFPVHAVFTWSNSRGSTDSELLKTKADMQKDNQTVLYQDAASPKRFNRHPNGLKLALRNLLLLADWIDMVHIVVADSDSLPPWLNTHHSKLRIVRHSQICPPHTPLPTFNSVAIESWLHAIPELAEHFIYFNDDMLVTGRVSRDLFFTRTGLPRFWPDESMGKLLGTPGPTDDSYWGLIRSSNELLRSNDVIGKQLIEAKYGFYVCEHQPRALTVGLMKRAHEMFGPQLAITGHNRLRSVSDVWAIHLAQQIGIADGTVVASTHPAQPFFFGILKPNTAGNEEMLARMAKSGALLVCVNRDIERPALDRKFEAAIQELMANALGTNVANRHDHPHLQLEVQSRPASPIIERDINTRPKQAVPNITSKLLPAPTTQDRTPVERHDIINQTVMTVVFNNSLPASSNDTSSTVPVLPHHRWPKPAAGPSALRSSRPHIPKRPQAVSEFEQAMYRGAVTETVLEQQSISQANATQNQHPSELVLSS